MTNRFTIRLVALGAALLIGLSLGGPITAQEAGDQIVPTEETPPADDSAAATDDAQNAQANETPDADQGGDTDTADDANSAESEDASSDDDSTQAATETASDAPDSAEADSDSESSDRLIVVEDLNLREEADVEADVIQVMPAGSVVTLAADGEAVNDFLPVNFEQDAGWAYLPFLTDVARGDNLAVVTTELNLRAGPSVDEDILDVMPEGAEVRVAGLATDDEGDDWNRVYYDGTLAWALASYVVFADDVTDSTDAADESDAAESSDAATSAESDETGAAGTADLVTVVDANLRAGSSLDDAVVSVVPIGTFAVVTGEAANGFVPVSVDGVAGWLSTDVIAPAEIAATLAEPAATTETTVTAAAAGDPSDDEPRTTLADVNLRAGPSADAEILLVVPAGDTVTLTFDGYENEFAAVSYQGTIGWILAELLQE